MKDYFIKYNKYKYKYLRLKGGKRNIYDGKQNEPDEECLTDEEKYFPIKKLNRNFLFNNREILKSNPVSDKYININKELKYEDVKLNNMLIDEIDKNNIHLLTNLKFLINDKEYDFNILLIQKHYNIIGNLIYFLTNKYLVINGIFKKEEVETMKILFNSFFQISDLGDYIDISAKSNLINKYLFINKVKELLEILYATDIDYDILIEHYNLKKKPRKKPDNIVSELDKVKFKLLKIFDDDQSKLINFIDTYKLYNDYGDLKPDMTKTSKDLDIELIKIKERKSQVGDNDKIIIEIESFIRLVKFIKYCNKIDDVTLKYFNVETSILFFFTYIGERLINYPILKKTDMIDRLFPININNVVLNLISPYNNNIIEKENQNLFDQINFYKKIIKLGKIIPTENNDCSLVSLLNYNSKLKEYLYYIISKKKINNKLVEYIEKSDETKTELEEDNKTLKKKIKKYEEKSKLEKYKSKLEKYKGELETNEGELKTNKGELEKYYSIRDKIILDRKNNLISPEHLLFIVNKQLPTFYLYSKSTKFIDSKGIIYNYSDCVENTLLQFFKTIYWDPESYRYNIKYLESDTKQLNEIKMIIESMIFDDKHDNSPDIINKFSQIVSNIPEINFIYVNNVNNDKYEIESSMENFKTIIKFILNLDLKTTDKELISYIKTINLKINDFDISSQKIIIKFKDINNKITFTILNHHSSHSIENNLPDIINKYKYKNIFIYFSNKNINTTINLDLKIFYNTIIDEYDESIRLLLPEKVNLYKTIIQYFLLNKFLYTNDFDDIILSNDLSFIIYRNDKLIYFINSLDDLDRKKCLVDSNFFLAFDTHVLYLLVRNDREELINFLDKFKNWFDSSIELYLDDKEICLINYIKHKFLDFEKHRYKNIDIIHKFLTEIS